MSERKALALFILLCALFGASSAKAHKLKTFATAIGAEISGYAYFVPGGRAQNAQVVITREDGSLAAHLQTNDQGEFSYRANQRTRLTIHVDAGDGHEADTHIAAADLPSTLPLANNSSAASRPIESLKGTDSPTASSLDLQQQIETALARQLRPLREQLDAWQEQIWLHDILGGLGYIIGLAGLAYGLTNNKRSTKPNSSTKRTKA
jgi:nickel transport protein